MTKKTTETTPTKTTKTTETTPSKANVVFDDLDNLSTDSKKETINTIVVSKKTTVDIVNESDNELPIYKTEGSVGMDLSAFIPKTMVLSPLDSVTIPTGIKIALPPCVEGQVRSRSGLAFKNQIVIVGGIGTIDSDYRGEIKLKLINLSKSDFVIKSGDRLAQIIFAKIEKIEWNQVKVLDSTERNEGGFGHTGI